MTTPQAVNTRDLFELIGELTNTQRGHEDPKNLASKVITWPSLWDQLIESTARGSGLDGGSVHRSRPPVSTDVLGLVDEIRRTTARQLQALGRKPIWQTRAVPDRQCEHFQPRPDSTIVETWRDIPAELRAINAAVISDNRREWWIAQLSTWIAQAKAALGENDPRITFPPGTRCMDCEQAWALVKRDGEDVRIPALQLVWHPNKGGIHYVTCRACGVSRWPRDLHALAEHQLTMMREHETLALDASQPATMTRNTDTPPTPDVANTQSDRVLSASHRRSVPRPRPV